MEENLEPSPNSNQFVLSYNLLCLIQWIIDNEADQLKDIITKALDAGLAEKMHKFNGLNELHLTEDVQHSIIDLLGLLEGLLNETQQEQTIQKALEKNLMPAIDHIDSSVCDDDTVKFSIEKATADMKDNSKEQAQEILFKELLKRWKPNKNTNTKN